MGRVIYIYNKVTSFLSNENEMEFLLYHLAKDENFGVDYIDFFRKCNKYKIFDNSFYELRREIDYDDYFNFAELLNVNEIILPDKLWDGEWTKQKVNEVLNEYYDYMKTKNWKIAAVIQGYNIGQIIENYLNFLRDERIDIIMIPRKVVHKDKWQKLNVKSYAEARLKIWEVLEKYREEYKIERKPVHFLGANSLWEILKVKHDENVRSIDTKWFSKMLLNRKWEGWVERDGWPFIEDLYKNLEQKWQSIKPVFDYDEKYGEI